MILFLLRLRSKSFFFLFSCSTFQEILAFYGRLQLNLTRGSSESSSLLEQLLNVVTRELDLGSSSSSASWYIFYLSSLRRMTSLTSTHLVKL